MKGFGDLGLDKAGIKLIGPGDITTDEELPNMGDVPLGVITMFHYSAAGDRPANKRVRRGVPEGVRPEVVAELHLGRRVGRHAGDLRRGARAEAARSTRTRRWRC